LEAKSFRAAKLPKIDLVAQYAMFARFNNYEDYFRTFSRHNAQLGASIQIPVLPDSQQEARAAQADIEGQRLRADLSAKRNHVQGETRKAWQRIREAESRRELAKLDLDVWREQISVLLAQADEGRATLRQVEEARFQENERWLLYYDARYAVERARLELLKETGALLAAVR
ncbi:MAG: TolC family protein, partial [Bryobacterales bacterium]|nr:TolC family protein [Bryobacterales bacterium]